MSSTFGGVELAKRALQAQQKSLEVTGHNIANANNDNYSRQRAIQSTTAPYAYPSINNSVGAGQVGTGVQVEKIERIRDQFIDKQLRHQNQSLGKWAVKKENLKQIETIFNELGEGGLVNNINSLWEGFQDLANEPQKNAGVRPIVVESAKTLTTQFNQFSQQLKKLREQLGEEIEGRVNKFNSLTSRIAALNNQIKEIEADDSKNANDLMDKRDGLIDELSKLADIDINIDEDNQANISLGGVGVVRGKYQYQLEFETKDVTKNAVDISDYALPTSDFSATDFSYTLKEYSFSVEGNEVEISNGELQGFREVRDTIQDYKMDKLDKLARMMIDKVNTQHRSGFDLKGDPGDVFFTGTDAASFEVDTAIIDNPDLIAASSNTTGDNDGDGYDDNQGNGENASKIFTILQGDFNKYWQGEVSALGVEIDRSERMESNQEILVDNLKQKRQEVSGVSLDEEMTEMVKFQHGYNAAAKVLSKMDEMLNTLINGVLR